MMKTRGWMDRFGVVALVAAALAVAGPSLAAAEAPAAGQGTVMATASGGKLVINARSVLYDFVKRFATFEKQVSVTDAQIMLTAERMDVFLTETNSVSRVEAIGDVVIRELGTAKKATAGKAIYDTTADTVVLTDQPYLEDRDQGFFTKGAETIVYLRGKQQFKAEGEGVQIEFGIPEDKVRSGGDLFRRDDKAPGTPDDKTRKEAPAP
mgnify:CR=1 FL=1